MERAKAELQASQAAEQERAKADAQRRQAGRSKEPDTARAEDDRAKLEALAREAAGVKPAKPIAPRRSGPRPRSWLARPSV